MPKRWRHGEHGGGRERLYLVFDDWRHGFGIRKVNPLAGENHEQAAVPAQAAVRRLPRAFSRMAAYPSTSAFGTRILAMDTGGPEDLDVDYFLMLDVRARGVTIGPRQDFLVADPIYYLPVGNNKLFILSRDVFVMLCLEERCPPVPVGSSSMEWSREDLPEPPFNVRDVTSYAVHPDGRTFLFSTKKNDAAEATFAFDTEELLWKRLGNWALPFAGRGYFDPHLRGFVGLSDDPDTLGQLYCCYVPGSDNGDRAPKWKLCEEKLFSDDDPAKRHVNATLVHMGCHGKFCLVQCVYVKDEQDDTADDQALIDERGVLRLPPGCRRLYRLTTFSLSHDRNGDLTTGKSRQQGKKTGTSQDQLLPPSHTRNENTSEENGFFRSYRPTDDTHPLTFVFKNISATEV